MKLFTLSKWKAAAFDTCNKPVEDETMEHTQPSASVLNTSAVVMECGEKEDQLSQTPIAQNSSVSEIVPGVSSASLAAASSPETQQLALSLRYLKEAHNYLGRYVHGFHNNDSMYVCSCCTS